MRHARTTTAGALGITALLALSACGSSGSSGASGAPASIGGADGEGETLTVWVMDGDYTEPTLDAINERFTEETGAEVDVQVQQWDGITTKVSTALSTSTPPDVLDLGNTQVPGYAANGALLDLSSYADDLRAGRTWLAGLEDPATIDGTLYAVPGFAGTRTVIYNTTMWADAGVTEPPTTYEELTSALDAVAAANGGTTGFAPFYYPAGQWYAGLQWVWDAGGEMATDEDGTWTGQMSSPESQQGLQQFKDFQNTYSTGASQTLDVLSPDQTQIFADGQTSAIIATSSSIDMITSANPDITEDDLGTFPFPGTSGEAQPVFLGGSVWGVAARTDQPDLALEWVSIAASPEIQDEYVFGEQGWIPNSTEAVEAAQATGLSPVDEGYFAASLRSRATPAAASWPTLEGDQSVNELFTSVASGSKTPEQAAADFDDHLESVLNEGQ
ncbi:extracellular solute-binding protein [Pseudokineococcus marinus]|uniref:Extracellular solute-binding protein n=1 Tax=Pseudokineococcus marinus TaxID=351215 RepID=A0A849BL75_9ACTN|nr:extracellular solute-binding protein [Pseudokineococcus marinus]NNH22073.1 extracellular solute-binding protein [Pseudokineococcus marinus]